MESRDTLSRKKRNLTKIDPTSPNDYSPVAAAVVALRNNSSPDINFVRYLNHHKISPLAPTRRSGSGHNNSTPEISPPSICQKDGYNDNSPRNSASTNQYVPYLRRPVSSGKFLEEKPERTARLVEENSERTAGLDTNRILFFDQFCLRKDMNRVPIIGSEETDVWPGYDRSHLSSRLSSRRSSRRSEMSQMNKSVLLTNEEWHRLKYLVSSILTQNESVQQKLDQNKLIYPRVAQSEKLQKKIALLKNRELDLQCDLATREARFAEHFSLRAKLGTCTEKCSQAASQLKDFRSMLEDQKRVREQLRNGMRQLSKPSLFPLDQIETENSKPTACRVSEAARCKLVHRETNLEDGHFYILSMYFHSPESELKCHPHECSSNPPCLTPDSPQTSKANRPALTSETMSSCPCTSPTVLSHRTFLAERRCSSTSAEVKDCFADLQANIQNEDLLLAMRNALPEIILVVYDISIRKFHFLVVDELEPAFKTEQQLVAHVLACTKVSLDPASVTLRLELKEQRNEGTTFAQIFRKRQTEVVWQGTQSLLGDFPGLMHISIQTAGSKHWVVRAHNTGSPLLYSMWVDLRALEDLAAQCDVPHQITTPVLVQILLSKLEFSNNHLYLGSVSKMPGPSSAVQQIDSKQANTQLLLRTCSENGTSNGVWPDALHIKQAHVLDCAFTSRPPVDEHNNAETGSSTLPASPASSKENSSKLLQLYVLLHASMSISRNLLSVVAYDPSRAQCWKGLFTFSETLQKLVSKTRSTRAIKKVPDELIQQLLTDFLSNVGGPCPSSSPTIKVSPATDDVVQPCLKPSSGDVEKRVGAVSEDQWRSILQEVYDEMEIAVQNDDEILVFKRSQSGMNKT